MHSLKKARLDLGYSQKMLADFTGLSIPTIKRIEAGKPIRIDNIRLICDYFSKRYNRDVKPHELGLTYEERQDSNETPYIDQNNSITNLSVFDLGITDKLDSAESIIDLAWDAWFAS